MNKKGLVFEGGGAKGAYHVGVLTALYEAGYSFDAVVGTSIGALNAAILAQDGLEVLKEFWHSVRISNIFALDDAFAESVSENGVKKENFIATLRLMRHPLKFVQTSGDRMEKYVKERINPDRLLGSQMKCGCVTYCVNKLKPVELFTDDMPKENIVDYFIASATFPLYGFYEFNGNKYVDGGIYDNMPINLIASKGYTDLIAIRTSTKPRKVKIKYDVDVKYIIPSEELGRMIAFVPKNINRCMKVGFFDGLRFLNGYLGKKYYIKPFDNNLFDDYFVGLPYDEMLDELDETRIIRTPDIVELKEFIKSNFNENLSDDECMLSIVELIALTLKIDRFQIFEIVDLLKGIKEKIRLSPQTDFHQIKNQKLRKLCISVAKYIEETDE